MLGKQAKFNLLSFFSTVAYKNAQNANFSLKVIKISSSQPQILHLSLRNSF